MKDYLKIQKPELGYTLLSLKLISSPSNVRML